VDDKLIAPILTIVVGTVIVSAILVPSMQRVRDVLVRFSQLAIPVRDELREEIGIVERVNDGQFKLLQESARRRFNTLYREYLLAQHEFRRVLRIFFYLLLGVANVALLVGEVTVQRVILLILLDGLVLLFWSYLRSEIAPRASKVVSVDFIGKYFSQLHHEAALQLAEFRILPHWDNNTVAFVIKCGIILTGFKYLLVVTSPDYKKTYFVSYGFVTSEDKVRHVLTVTDNEFDIVLGEITPLIYAHIDTPMKYTFVVLYPDPISWFSFDKKAYCVESEPFETFHRGQRAQVYFVHPSIGSSTECEGVTFKRSKWVPWWKITIGDAPEHLRKWLPKMSTCSGQTCLSFPG
jgi:hypothetical protein